MRNEATLGKHVQFYAQFEAPFFIIREIELIDIALECKQ